MRVTLAGRSHAGVTPALHAGHRVEFPLESIPDGPRLQAAAGEQARCGVKRAGVVSDG